MCAGRQALTGVYETPLARNRRLAFLKADARAHRQGTSPARVTLHYTPPRAAAKAQGPC